MINLVFYLTKKSRKIRTKYVNITLCQKISIWVSFDRSRKNMTVGIIFLKK